MKTDLFRTVTLVLAAAAALRAQDVKTTVVEASHVVLAPGEVLDGEAARIAFRDGKIVAVGREIAADVIARATRIRLPEGAVVVPGMIVLHDQLGLAGDLAETIDAFTPELRAADAFDPFDRVLPRRAQSGITSVLLAPTSTNTFGGIAALVKWNGTRGVVASAEGYLKMALVGSSLSRERYPTSRMGAAELIRGAFADARDPLRGSTPALAVLREAADGGRRVLIHASSHAEVSGALDIAAEVGITPILLDVVEIEDCLPRLRGKPISVSLRALGWNSEEKALDAPAKLAAAGVRFSFCSADGRGLRRSAALAVRHGLDRKTALDAITRIPAEQSGFGDRLGSLRVGRDADFDVFDGDPIELTSRLLEVWVDGRRQPIASAAPSGAEVAR
ncbi:MAG: amidohydrolase family protein [Planctomycetota bacterium]